ncbi:general amidase [Pisolithus thermaeus]|nr:general amidase [Pisolithus thermaeus]
MPSWYDLAVDKRQRQSETIPSQWRIQLPPESALNVIPYPETCGLLTPEEIEITNASVEILLLKLAAGKWSSFVVTTAFYKRAVVSHQLVNCLTEIFVERALARATELDEYMKKTGKVAGPLHGLPISLKDQLCIKGLETTMGYVSWIGKYAKSNAVLVDILYECGAVPFVRTNVPQTLMWGETFNNIFGRTSNPHNRSLTSGGSSGGEGALLALKGSPLGVGSDIGGSIRDPAALCGVYGLRPSYGRIPYGGAVNSMEGQDSMPSVLGPLSGSVGGLKIFMEAVINTEPWLRDPLTVRKHWNDEEYKLADHGRGKDLCFAIMWDDGVVIPHPPVKRALEMTKKALIKAGHKVIDWTPLKHRELSEVAFDIWRSGSVEDFAVTTSATGEPLIHTMLPDDKKETFLPSLRTQTGLTAYQLWQVQRYRRDLRAEYMAHWNATSSQTGTGRPVDAIICPAKPYAAPPHGRNRSYGYTVVWNVLDYTASVFPVTSVDPHQDTKLPPHEFIDAFDQEIYELYEPQAFQNAPVCLQLVGRTLEEEAVLAMTEIVDLALKG